MKKRIVALLLLVAMLVSLVACNSNEPAPTGDSGNAGNTVATNFTVPEGGYDGSNVTISFYHTWVPT